MRLPGSPFREKSRRPNPGETIYAPPGVLHWHGAAPDQGGVQYNVARGMTTWGEGVTEKEYTAAPMKQ